MQMMMAGFITWITPENDKSNAFGIKYPMPPSLLDKNQRENFNKELFERDRNENFISKMIVNKHELQIINRDNFPLGQFSINGNDGIKAKLSYNDERFVYELRIPIAGSNNNINNQINVKPGGKVEIQYQTVEFDAEGMRGMQGMRPAGDLAENQPMGGGMRGDRSSERQFSRPEPFNYTVEVTLDSVKK